MEIDLTRIESWIPLSGVVLVSAVVFCMALLASWFLRVSYVLDRWRKKSMGAIFKLEHGNIMAYLTSRSFAAPRVRQNDLVDFLQSFIDTPGRHILFEKGHDRWPYRVADLAERALEKFRELESSSTRDPDSLRQRENIVNGRIVEGLLSELRSEFSYYPLFALAVGGGKELQAKAKELAKKDLYGNLLVLIPDETETAGNFNVIDPVPSFSVSLHAAAEWPGFAFWTPNGAGCFCSLREIDEFTNLVESQIIHRGDEFRSQGHPRRVVYSGWFDTLLKNWDRSHQSRSRRLLHLSDLHFGTNYATENQPLLDAELRDVVKNVDRVVITGDLFDTPDQRFATLFTTFRNNITHLSGGVEPISITGNHDQRLKGIWGKNYEQVANIGPSRVEVDDKSQMVFLCFNSSEGGTIARGMISSSQFKRIGAEYRNLLASRSELKSYLPIVLVHHHPFSFEAEPVGLLERMMNKVGFSLERTLVLTEPEKLHEWCVDWNIKTILHGHKHKARYVERVVSHAGKSMLLTAIGCGSSLGAEDSPVSYNLLEWEPRTRKWVASFHQSINGGAFQELAVSVSA